MSKKVKKESAFPLKASSKSKINIKNVQSFKSSHSTMVPRNCSTPIRFQSDLTNFNKGILVDSGNIRASTLLPITNPVGAGYKDGTPIIINSFKKSNCSSTIVSGQHQPKMTKPAAQVQTGLTGVVVNSQNVHGIAKPTGFVSLSSFQSNNYNSTVASNELPINSLAPIQTGIISPNQEAQNTLTPFVFQNKVFYAQDQQINDLEIAGNEEIISNPTSQLHDENPPAIVDDQRDGLDDDMSLNSSHHSNNGHEEINENGQEPIEDVLQLLRREEATHVADKCCNACRLLLVKLIEKVDELKLMVTNVNINNNGATRPGNTQNDYTMLTMLPLNDVGELKLFDGNLIKMDEINKQITKQFEQKVSVIGGADVKKAVNSVLAEVLTDELALNLVWTIKVENKTAIEHYNFPQIISRILAKDNQCTEQLVKSRIQLWLQKAGDRIRSKNKKMQRQQAVQDEDL